MPEQNQDAQAGSSSALGEAIASLPEVQQEAQSVQQESQAPTAQQGETQEQNVPFNQHPRFQELIEERNYYREQLSNLIQQRQQQPQQPQQAPQEIGNTPEEREFWRMQRQIAREEAMKVASEKEKEISNSIAILTQEITSTRLQDFRNRHPDIKPNSPEERAIAEKVAQRIPLEDAYRIVMYDKKIAEAGKQGVQQSKQQMEAKKQANVEQNSIPPIAVPPTKEKLTLRQRIEKNAKEMGF
jgi:hypothetical protein